MSRYREYEPMKESYEPTADDLYRLEKLLEAKKLTDKQKEALSKLLHFYYYTVD